MATTLPPQIEIFRTGRHTDDQGTAREFTHDDLRAIAAGYNPAQREAPLTVGHPNDDLPAYGWVQSLDVTPEGRLVMNVRDVEPQFAELVSARRFAKRSAAFYPPQHPNNPNKGNWYLRHVAFLGAQPPAVAGLRDIQFADDAAGLVLFSEAAPPTKERSMTEQENAAREAQAAAEAEAKAARAAQAAAEAAAEAAKKELAQFAEKQRAERHASHVAFCEGLAAATGAHAGKLLPADVQIAAAALDMLADAEPVQFSEGNTTRSVSACEWLKTKLTAAAPVVQYGEFAGGSVPGFDTAPPRDDEALDARVKAYAAEHKVSYAEALNACVASFTS